MTANDVINYYHLIDVFEIFFASALICLAIFVIELTNFRPCHTSRKAINTTVKLRIRFFMLLLPWMMATKLLTKESIDQPDFCFAVGYANTKIEFKSYDFNPDTLRSYFSVFCLEQGVRKIKRCLHTMEAFTTAKHEMSARFGFIHSVPRATANYFPNLRAIIYCENGRTDKAYLSIGSYCKLIEQGRQKFLSFDAIFPYRAGSKSLIYEKEGLTYMWIQGGRLAHPNIICRTVFPMMRECPFYHYRDFTNSTLLISSGDLSKLLPGPNLPFSLGHHCSVIWPNRNKIIIYGGYNDFGIISNQTWTFDLVKSEWHQLNTINRNPCLSVDMSIVVDMECAVVKSKLDDQEWLLVPMFSNEDGACTAALNFQTLKWYKSALDQRHGIIGGHIVSMEDNSRLLYLSGRSISGELQRTIFEFINLKTGWIQWSENVLPVAFDNATFIQINKDFCSTGEVHFIDYIPDPDLYHSQH